MSPKKKPAKKAKKPLKKKAKALKKAKKKVKKAVKKTRPKARPKKAAKKPAKSAAKPKSPVAKVPAQKPAAKTAPAGSGVPGSLGKVVHYYDRIQVAIVQLRGSLKVGDKILFKKGEREFVQTIRSIQVHHQPLQSASAGQVVGLKVAHIAPEGTHLFKAK
jgi:hypothetical protein